MAISFDAAGAVTFDTNVTSFNFSHTCTGSNRLLLVAVLGPTSDLITDVTYNSVSMTMIDHLHAGSGRYIHLFGLLGPASGAHTGTVTASGSCDVIATETASYAGVKQTGFPDNHATSTPGGSPASHSQTMTLFADNCWAAMYAFQANGTGGGAGAATTLRSGVGAHGLFDGDAAVTPAGNTTLACTADSGAGEWTSIMVSFEPAGAEEPPPSGIPFITRLDAVRIR